MQFDAGLAECSRVARESGTIVLKYFLASPDDQHSVDIAKGMCAVCNVVYDCLIAHWDNDTVIAGNTSAFERRMMRWKRIKQVGDSNWRSLDEIVSLIGGEEK